MFGSEEGDIVVLNVEGKDKYFVKPRPLKLSHFK